MVLVFEQTVIVLVLQNGVVYITVLELWHNVRFWVQEHELGWIGAANIVGWV